MSFLDPATMFTTRNLYYLKISASVVLPLYLYLDQKHVHWMSDYVLQQVLRDLKPLIGPKMLAEGDDPLFAGARNPNATADPVYGEGYRFLFFFRRLEEHSVLIKTRNFRMVPTTQDAREEEPEPISQPVSMALTSGSRKRGKKRARTTDEDDDVEMAEETAPGRKTSKRKKPRTATHVLEGDAEDEGQVSDNGSIYDPDMDNQLHEDGVKQEETDIILPPAETLSVDVEEDKPKMAMHLSYTGHHVAGRYICVVVAPWPPLRPDQLPPEPAVEPLESRFRVAPEVPRLQNIAEMPPNSRAGSVRFRSETPLFLPEDGLVRDETPAPTRHIQTRTLPPVPPFDNAASTATENDNTDNFMAFSQALANVQYQIGGSDSEEDYMRGDADEEQRVIE